MRTAHSTFVKETEDFSCQVLPVVMLSYMENQFDPSIAAVSTVQMLIAIVVLLIADRVYGIEKLTS
jgi:putative spermidine/putrescine transport system permease protein